MARYYPIIKVRADVEIKVYAKPVPENDERAVIYAIFAGFSKWLLSEGVRVKVEQNSAVWSFGLIANDAQSCEFPNPFSNWIEDEERWDDKGGLVANKEEVSQMLRTSFREYIKEVSEVAGGVEVCVEIHEINLLKTIVRRNY